MIFNKKKKGMIDIRKLQQQGRISEPKKDNSNIPTDNDGFVEMNSLSSSSFSTSADGYSKKEVDSKIQELDKLIYKLEQRIEVLEKKAGVNSGYSTESSNNAGLISW